MTDGPEVPVDGRLGEGAEANIKRVFVGIPDVFSAEQLARFNGLHLVKELHMFDYKGEKGGIPKLLEDAEVMAQYMLTGKKEA